jgi:hypothetical protein
VSLGGLDQCACKRGFFTLRDCANAASTSCSTCSRRVCDDHVAEPGLCVECAAKRDEEGAFAPADDPTRAAVGYRTRWYERRHYSPIWWGTTDPYWATTDYRWYDDDRDDDGGGFSDS